MTDKTHPPSYILPPSHSLSEGVATKEDTMHTPTPLQLEALVDETETIQLDPNDGSSLYQLAMTAIAIPTDEGKHIVGYVQDNETAEKIVVAVNAHDALILALDDLRVFADGIRDEWQDAHPGKEYNPLRLALIERAQAALTLAKKETD